MRILAVDDDAIFLDLLTQVLNAAGYDEVTLARSTDEALSTIGASTIPFDCFLLDIRMPGKDGISLCKEVRTISAYSDAPILMLTGMKDTKHIDCAFEAGATDYISKPLNGLELGTRINVARMLCVQRRQLADRSQVIVKLREEIVKQPSIALENSFKIENLKGHIDYTEIQNQLLRLPSGAYRMDIFALKITNVEKYYHEMDDTEFQDFIAKVAGVIIFRLSPLGFKISYAGNGAFGCVRVWTADVQEFGQDRSPDAKPLRFEVTTESGDALSVELVQGRPQSPKIWSGINAAAALDRAVQRVDEKSRDDFLQANLEANRLSDDTIRPQRVALGRLAGCRGTRPSTRFEENDSPLAR